MADIADNSDEKVLAFAEVGIEAARRNSINNRLRPIIFQDEGSYYGICHWCESPIKPGNLFCEKDPNDPGMCCSESLDHEMKRRRDTGV